MGRAVRAFPHRPFSAGNRFSEHGQVRVNEYAIRGSHVPQKVVRQCFRSFATRIRHPARIAQRTLPLRGRSAHSLLRHAGPTSALPPAHSFLQRTGSPTRSSSSRPSSPPLRTGGRHLAERAYVRSERAFRADSFGELNRLRPASATQLRASSSSSSFGSLRSFGAPKIPPPPPWRCGVAREPIFAAVPRHNVLSFHRVGTTSGFAPLGL